jgi:hypothetical protein
MRCLFDELWTMPSQRLKGYQTRINAILREAMSQKHGAPYRRY